MRRLLLYCAALAAFAAPSRADQPVPSSETVIRLSVHAMPVPQPALRYLLLPELKDINPGNPVHGYLRCFAEQQNFFFNKDACERRDQYQSMPLGELPAQELQDYGKFALRQADWAARLDKPDWEILLKLKIDGLGVLLPDVQQLRTLAAALKVRFRAQVALGRFDDALRTAQTMLAMAHHLGDHPTFVGDVVGVAIAFVAIGPLEEMLEQSGCPNLYWALTNLPNPLVPLDKGAEGERVWVGPAFRDLDESAPMSADQIKRFIAPWDPILRLNEGKPSKQDGGIRAWLDARNKDEELVRAARRRLVEAGLSEERVQCFPADQVLLLDEKRAYEVRRDEGMKLLNLPEWQIEALAVHIKPPSETGALFPLEPAILKVRWARGRLEQRIALLRHIEALRLYAADHDGKLPARLSEVAVPLPDDPFTGKPFRYEVVGTTAHLRGSPPSAEKKNPANNVHYEITMQK